jgi:hypothetical protein
MKAFNTTALLMCLSVFCSNPVVNNQNESVITCLNGNSFAIRYNYYPQGTYPQYFSNNIKPSNWTTLELQFNLRDSLKFISFCPNMNDTLLFDTIWAEDTNNYVNVYTFGSVKPDSTAILDTTGQLFFGGTVATGAAMIKWDKYDKNTIEVYATTQLSDTTYAWEIHFLHPIISNGHVRIRMRMERP